MLGPRLDRPSAIGAEGRPRATSLSISAVIVVAVLVVAGFIEGEPLLFTSIALFVMVVTAGFALLDRERLGAMVVGHFCFLPGAIVISAVVAYSGVLALESGGQTLLVLGSLTAMFGVTTAWNDVLHGETVKSALVNSALAYLLWLIGLVVFGVLGVFAYAGRAAVTVLLNGPGPFVALAGLLGLLGLVCGALYIATRALPVIQLTPAHRREAKRDGYSRLKSRLLYGMVGAWGLLGIAVTGAASGVLQLVVSVPPIASVLAAVTSAATIPLVCVVVVSLLIAGVSWTARKVTSGFESVSTGTVAAAIAATGYMFALLLAIPSLLRYGYGGVAFFISIPILPVFVYSVLVAVLLGLYLGVLPERAASSAAVAAGLVCVGIGGALSGYPSLFVFGAVAGGLVAWDVGTFGLSVTAELGHLPETRRLELYHGVFTVGVGLVGVAVLTLLDATRQSVAGGVGTPVAMGIAVVGVSLLLLPLRG